MIDSLIGLDKELLLTLNGSSSLYADALMTTLTKAQTWIPLYVALFYLVVKNNESVRKIVSILCCAGLCVLLAGTVDDTIVKPLVARWRPTHDPEIGMLVDVVNGYRGGNYGFFSAHAANTFSIATFFTILVRNRYLSFSLIVWSLVNCWTRLYLGVHFPIDILCGLLWGATVATAVYFLFRYVENKYAHSEIDYVSSKYTSTGYRYSDIHVVALVMAFTLVYCIIKSVLLA